MVTNDQSSRFKSFLKPYGYTDHDIFSAILFGQIRQTDSYCGCRFRLWVLRKISASCQKTMWKLASNTTASTWNSDRDLSRIRSRQKTFSLMKNMTIKRNRTIELNYQLWKCRQKAGKMLCSEKDLKHRERRYIEPKEVFGHIKYNMNYKRSRHLKKDKILMGFFFLAIAFNIKTICAKMRKKKI